MKRFILHISIIFFNLSLCISSYSQSLKQDSLLIKGKLDNGLTYYIYPNKSPKGEAVYRLFIKSGSVYETDAQKGLAHFLEHMAFNGTSRFPSNSVIRFLESKGAKFGKDLNAHTSYNETVYKLQLPSTDNAVVDSAITILADWAGGLTLDSLEIEKERGVIISEWLSKAGPKHEMQGILLAELLNNSVYADRPVIGDTAVIKNFRHKELRDYYRTWYDPSLIAVAVVGDIDPAETEQAIIKKFSYLQSNLNSNDIPYHGITPFDSMGAKKIVDELLDKTELIAIQILPKLPAILSEETYLPYVQRTILNRLLKSRMAELSFNNPPYKKASIGVSDFLNTISVFMASVELVPNKIKEGIDSFGSNIEQIFRYGFMPIEIEKIKEEYITSLKRRVLSEPSIKSTTIMDHVYADFYRGHMIITPEDELRLAEKYIDCIDSLSLVGYLQEMADWNKTHFILSTFDNVVKEFTSENDLVRAFKNLEVAEIFPYHKNVDIHKYILSAKPKAGRIVKREFIGEIEAYRFALSNGATVIFKPSDIEKGKMNISGFRAGGLYALDSTQYVSGLYAGSLIALSGAGEFSRDGLSHYLAGNTTSVRFLIDKTRSGIVGSAARADWETLFQLLYLKWTQPRLDSLVFRQAKERAIESCRTSNPTESEKFNQELSYILQGRNYTNRQLTDIILDEELKEGQIIDIFNRLFGKAGGFTFVLVGDATLMEIETLITRYLASLPKGKSETIYKFRREKIQLSDTLFERHTGENPRAAVCLAFQQSEVKDNIQLESLKNSILKSVVRAKLLKSLREDMGMIYSVSVSASSTIHPSPLSRQIISFVTAPENVIMLIERTHAELDNMAANPDSFEAELSDVKENLMKEMRLDVQKVSFWSTYIRNTIFNHEMNWTYVHNFDELVHSISVKDIASIIAEKMLNKRLRMKAILYPAVNEDIN